MKQSVGCHLTWMIDRLHNFANGSLGLCNECLQRVKLPVQAVEERSVNLRLFV